MKKSFRITRTDRELLGLRYNEERRIVASREWKQCKAANNALFSASLKASTFTIEYNATHWAFDVFRLLREIVFSATWMKAYASMYRKRVPLQSGPAHGNLSVSYFADNCVTRIDSCRDKLALMVWAFYVPFNPDEKREVPDFQRILERLKCPLKFGLGIKKHEEFLSSLETLHTQDFKQLEKYRDLKIHRREPRIEMHGVQPYHDWPYLIPLTKDDEIVRWKASLRGQYPSADEYMLKTLEEGCRINEVLFDQRRLKSRLWNYDDVEKHVDGSLQDLIKASTSCFRTLIKKLPRSKKLTYPRAKMFL